jgi:hypothetical protein
MAKDDPIVGITRAAAATADPAPEETTEPPAAGPVEEETAPSTPSITEPDEVADQPGQMPARVSLTTVALAVQHRQRGTGVDVVQRAMIASGAKGITDDGMPGDAFDDAVAKLRTKWRMGDGGVDGPFLARLGLDVQVD